VARIGYRRPGYRVLVGRPGGKRPLARPRYRWENNIKIDLHEMERGMDWIDVTLDRNMWQARMNAVTTFGFLKLREIS
jgi:hypothetical protein